MACAAADAIVVLGCRLERDGRPSPALRCRLRLAERAWHAGLAPWVVVSGGRSWYGRVEAVAMRRWLEAAGLPADALTTEHRSLRTLDNARQSASLLRMRRARRVIVVTSPAHLGRALRAFSRHGLEPCAPPESLRAALPELPVRPAERWAERLRFVADEVASWVGGKACALLTLVAAGFVAAFGLGACSEPAPTASTTTEPSATSPPADAGPEVRSAGPLLRAELGRRASEIGDADLSSRDVQHRRAAVRALARIGSAETRPGLLRALSDEDLEVVAWASYGLGRACAGHAEPTVAALVAAGARVAEIQRGLRAPLVPGPASSAPADPGVGPSGSADAVAPRRGRPTATATYAGSAAPSSGPASASPLSFEGSSPALAPGQDGVARAPRPEGTPDAALVAIARAIGQCGGPLAESSLSAWIGAQLSVRRAACYGLGDLADGQQKLREETLVALLNLAAGDALEDPLDEGLYPLTRLKHLPPSVLERALEVAQAALDRPGPLRSHAVTALCRTGDQGVEALTKVVRDVATFRAAERAAAARCLGTLGRAGQRALADLLAELTPTLVPSGDGPGGDAAPAVDPSQLRGEGFGPWLTLLQSRDAVGKSRASLLRIAQLSAGPEPSRSIVLRASLLRCTAAQLLVERDYTADLLRSCELPSPGAPAGAKEPGTVGALALVEAIGIPGAKMRGARERRWLELLDHSQPRVRERAIELLTDHAEVSGAAQQLARALRASEPGLVATAAEVIAKVPARAGAEPSTKRKPAEDSSVPLTPLPDIVKALTELLEGKGPTVDVEALGAVIDAVAALRMLEALPAIERHCTSPQPTIRAKAQLALRRLGPEGASPSCPPPADGTALPPEVDHLVTEPVTIELDTDAGTLRLRLDPALAPAAVTRVVGLVRAGFYDGMSVHRVVPGFVAQFGSPTADGYGGAPGLPPLPCETSPVHFAPLSVGVALSGRDTGSSQLFVTLADYPHLDGQYAWLGTADGPWAALAQGDVITKARILP